MSSSPSILKKFRTTLRKSSSKSDDTLLNLLESAYIEGQKHAEKEFGKKVKVYGWPKSSQQHYEDIINQSYQEGWNHYSNQTNSKSNSVSNSQTNSPDSKSNISQDSSVIYASSQGKLLATPPRVNRQPVDKGPSGDFANKKKPIDDTLVDNEHLYTNDLTEYGNDAGTKEGTGYYYDPNDTQGGYYGAKTDKHEEATLQQLGRQGQLKTAPSAYYQEQEQQKKHEQEQTEKDAEKHKENAEKDAKKHKYDNGNDSKARDIETKDIDPNEAHQQNKSVFNSNGIDSAVSENPKSKDSHLGRDAAGAGIGAGIGAAGVAYHNRDKKDSTTGATTADATGAHHSGSAGVPPSSNDFNYDEEIKRNERNLNNTKSRLDTLHNDNASTMAMKSPSSEYPPSDDTMTAVKNAGVLGGITAGAAGAYEAAKKLTTGTKPKSEVDESYNAGVTSGAYDAGRDSAKAAKVAGSPDAGYFGNNKTLDPKTLDPKVSSGPTSDSKGSSNLDPKVQTQAYDEGIKSGSSDAGAKSAESKSATTNETNEPSAGLLSGATGAFGAVGALAAGALGFGASGGSGKSISKDDQLVIDNAYQAGQEKATKDLYAQNTKAPSDFNQNLGAFGIHENVRDPKLDNTGDSKLESRNPKLAKSNDKSIGEGIAAGAAAGLGAIGLSEASKNHKNAKTDNYSQDVGSTTGNPNSLVENVSNYPDVAEKPQHKGTNFVDDEPSSTQDDQVQQVPGLTSETERLNQGKESNDFSRGKDSDDISRDSDSVSNQSSKGLFAGALGAAAGVLGYRGYKASESPTSDRKNLVEDVADDEEVAKQPKHRTGNDSIDDSNIKNDLNADDSELKQSKANASLERQHAKEAAIGEYNQDHGFNFSDSKPLINVADTDAHPVATKETRNTSSNNHDLAKGGIVGGSAIAAAAAATGLAKKPFNKNGDDDLDLNTNELKEIYDAGYKKGNHDAEKGGNLFDDGLVVEVIGVVDQKQASRLAKKAKKELEAQGVDLTTGKLVINADTKEVYKTDLDDTGSHTASLRSNKSNKEVGAGALGAGALGAGALGAGAVGAGSSGYTSPSHGTDSSADYTSPSPGAGSSTAKQYQGSLSPPRTSINPKPSAETKDYRGGIEPPKDYETPPHNLNHTISPEIAAAVAGAAGLGAGGLAYSSHKAHTPTADYNKSVQTPTKSTDTPKAQTPTKSETHSRSLSAGVHGSPSSTANSESDIVVTVQGGRNDAEAGEIAAKVIESLRDKPEVLKTVKEIKIDANSGKVTDENNKLIDQVTVPQVKASDSKSGTAGASSTGAAGADGIVGAAGAAGVVAGSKSTGNPAPRELESQPLAYKEQTNYEKSGNPAHQGIHDSGVMAPNFTHEPVNNTSNLQKRPPSEIGHQSLDYHEQGNLNGVKGASANVTKPLDDDTSIRGINDKEIKQALAAVGGGAVAGGAAVGAIHHKNGLESSESGLNPTPANSKISGFDSSSSQVKGYDANADKDIGIGHISTNSSNTSKSPSTKKKLGFFDKLKKKAAGDNGTGVHRELDSKNVDSKTVDPKAVDPKAVDSKITDPKYVDSSKNIDSTPRTVDSKNADSISRNIDPKDTGYASSRNADANHIDSMPARNVNSQSKNIDSQNFNSTASGNNHAMDNAALGTAAMGGAALGGAGLLGATHKEHYDSNSSGSLGKETKQDDAYYGYASQNVKHVNTGSNQHGVVENKGVTPSTKEDLSVPRSHNEHVAIEIVGCPKDVETRLQVEKQQLINDHPEWIPKSTRKIVFDAKTGIAYDGYGQQIPNLSTLRSYSLDERYQQEPKVSIPGSFFN